MFKSGLSAVFSMILVSSPAFAASFFVDETQVNGAPESWKSLAPGFVRAEVQAEKSHTLVSTKESADFVLVPMLFNMDDHYFVVVEKRSQGSVKFTSQMKVTKSDDIDVAFRRATRAALSETDVRTTADVNTVTERESLKGTLVKKSKFNFGGGLGPVVFMNLGADEFGKSFHLMGSWDAGAVSPYLRLDSTDLDSSFRNVSTTTFGIGANVFLNDREHSPYIGGDLSFGDVDVYFPDYSNGPSFTADEDGFALSANAGYQFLRTSSVRLDAGVRYSLFMFKVDGKIPSTLAAQVGIHF